MLRMTLVAAVTLGAGLAMDGGAAQAGHGCASERARECYEKVRRPDVYETVERKVLIAPPRRDVRYEPAVIENRPYRVEVAPQRVRAEHIPAVYSTVTRRQLVEPARVDYRHEPAVTRRMHETVVTHPGGVRWERTVGHHGQEKMCKVHVRAQTATVVRDVVVSPARRVPVMTPAVYRDVAVPVLVSPARVHHVVEPARYAVEHRPVVLKPAHTYVVEHPAVVGVETKKVLVHSGGHEWQRTGGGEMQHASRHRHDHDD